MPDLLNTVPKQLLIGGEWVDADGGATFEVHNPADGSVLTIVPTPEEVAPPSEGRELPPIPDWELFTPYNRFLRVGPGQTWAYLPSDQPEPAAVPVAD